MFVGRTNREAIGKFLREVVLWKAPTSSPELYEKLKRSFAGLLQRDRISSHIKRSWRHRTNDNVTTYAQPQKASAWDRKKVW